LINIFDIFSKSLATKLTQHKKKDIVDLNLDPSTSNIHATFYHMSYTYQTIYKLYNEHVKLNLKEFIGTSYFSL